jgi:hypothetical protein
MARPTAAPDFEGEWRRRESNPRPRKRRQNLYKRSPHFALARRPVYGLPTDGPAILWCRASGDWLSLGVEPVRWRRYPGHGPSQERRVT